ncbi:MAG: hypothetical protein K6G22_11900 [Lachnospiraceae bacterium]|nr:hypothetical protein [Lachnospiraceae bacterium]
MKTHGRLKRILALIAAVLLALMYLSTLIFALLRSPHYMELLRASIALTLILPALLYAYLLIYRVLKDKDDKTED